MVNGDLFYSGGKAATYLKTSYIYIKHENRWEKKADMTHKRGMHGCGRVTNPTTGKEEVVVAGGNMKSGYLSSSEIYTVEDNTWRDGTPLPKALEGIQSLPYGNSFLLLGGYNGSCQDSIYQVHTFIMSFVESGADICLSQEIPKMLVMSYLHAP